MKVVFNPEAEAEFLDSVDYYEAQSPGLGETFREAVNDAVMQAALLPLLSPVYSGRIRRCLVHRFPYGIFYNVQPGCVYVVAVMNLRRRPGYWKHRKLV